MTQNVFIKPAEPHLVVPDPHTHRALKADGEWKPLIPYWSRRLVQLDVIPAEASEVSAEPDAVASPAVAVGDMVQVIIGGAATFKKPKRVRELRDLDGTTFVFVDGSESGAPIEQVEVVSRADPTS
jgi:Protein of unknown function (DUF2635)